MDHTPYLTAYVGEIGKIIFSASVFDDELTKLLSECFNLTEFQENALLRPLSTRAKIGNLGRLAKLFMRGGQLKRLSAWCDTATKKLDDRNALVHGQPGQDGSEVTFRLFSGQRGIFGKPEVWTIDRVCDLRDYFIDAVDEIEKTIRPQFQAWIEETHGQVHSQPDASPAPLPK